MSPRCILTAFSVEKKACVVEAEAVVVNKSSPTATMRQSYREQERRSSSLRSSKYNDIFLLIVRDKATSGLTTLLLQTLRRWLLRSFSSRTVSFFLPAFSACHLILPFPHSFGFQADFSLAYFLFYLGASSRTPSLTNLSTSGWPTGAAGLAVLLSEHRARGGNPQVQFPRLPVYAPYRQR